MNSYLSIAEENAEWLAGKPRERIIRIKSVSGTYARLFFSKNSAGTYEGIACYLEDEALALMVYPLNPRWEVVGKYERATDYWNTLLKERSHV